MINAGAVLATGLALAFLALFGICFAFAWAMATLETYGLARARPAFMVLAFFALAFIVGAALIGWAATSLA